MLAGRKAISSSNQQLLARWLVPLLDRGSPYSLVDLGLPLLETQKLNQVRVKQMVSLASELQSHLVEPLRKR